MGKRKQGDQSASAPDVKRHKRPPTNKIQLSYQLNSLPIEILETILLQYLSSVPSQQYYSSLQQLRLVCRHWSTIIMEAPAFWSFIDPALGQSHINMVAKRSGTMSLTICDSSPGRHHRSHNYYHDLCCYAERWRSARLCMCCHFWMQARAGVNHGKSRMETLQHLELIDYACPGRYLLTAYLTDSLATPFLPQLSVLQLRHRVPSPDWLLSLLVHCPSIVHFALRPPLDYYNAPKVHSTSSDPIELLHMETIDIHHHEPSFCAALLRGLRTPNCASRMLQLQSYSDAEALPALGDHLLTYLRDVLEAASILEFKNSRGRPVEVKIQADDGTVLLLKINLHRLSRISLVSAWLLGLTKEMPHLRSSRIDYLLEGRSFEQVFDPEQPLWSLPKVMELRIRVGELWGMFPVRVTNATILSALGNPKASGKWMLPELTRLSIESETRGTFRLVDIRNMLRSRYSRSDDCNDPPKPLEELRVTVWRKQTKTFEEIEAIVGRDRFVKVRNNV